MAPEAHAIGRPGDYPAPSAPHAAYGGPPSQTFSPPPPPPPAHNRPPQTAGYSGSQGPGFSGGGPLGQALNLVGNVAGQGAKNSIQNLASCECDDAVFPRPRMTDAICHAQRERSCSASTGDEAGPRQSRTLDRNLLPMLRGWFAWLRTPMYIIVRLVGRFRRVQHNKLGCEQRCFQWQVLGMLRIVYIGKQKSAGHILHKSPIYLNKAVTVYA